MCAACLSEEWITSARIHEPARYWRGEPFVLKRRLSNFERVLAVITLTIAGLATLAAIAVAVIETGRTCCKWAG